jgi:hypothetical protein
MNSIIYNQPPEVLKVREEAYQRILADFFAKRPSRSGSCSHCRRIYGMDQEVCRIIFQCHCGKQYTPGSFILSRTVDAEKSVLAVMCKLNEDIIRCLQGVWLIIANMRSRLSGLQESWGL